MPPTASFTIADFERISRERQIYDLGTFAERPLTPDNIIVLGLKFGFRVQWSRVDDVDGYRVAVLSNQNLESPDFIATVPGEQTLQWEYLAGDVAIAKYFAVQSYKGDLSSEFTALATATSKVDGGAADSAPAIPPDQAQTPETSEEPGWGRLFFGL